MKPLAIDLFCGLGGWTEGLLAEGYEVVGFDVERHRYPARATPEGDARKVQRNGVDFNNPPVGSSANRSFNYANEVALRSAPLTGGWIEYPAQLVVQDVLTLHGSQFKDAAVIVASPPCQEYSWMAMPWSRARQVAAALRGEGQFPADYKGSRTKADLNRLFDACFRIQREASAAAGRRIPLVVENVRGAQPWVGRAAWSHGSFYLWGDVPALMPMVLRARKFNPDRVGHATKNTGGPWFAIAHNTTSGKGQNPDGRKQPGLLGVRANGKGDRWLQDGAASHGSQSNARKMASAMIAKIPIELSRHIGRSWYPRAAP